MHPRPGAATSGRHCTPSSGSCSSCETLACPSSTKALELRSCAQQVQPEPQQQEPSWGREYSNPMADEALPSQFHRRGPGAEAAQPTHRWACTRVIHISSTWAAALSKASSCVCSLECLAHV